MYKGEDWRECRREGLNRGKEVKYKKRSKRKRIKRKDAMDRTAQLNERKKSKKKMVNGK